MSKIIYLLDASSSMLDRSTLPDRDNKPRYEILNSAMSAVIGRLSDYLQGEVQTAHTVSIYLFSSEFQGCLKEKLPASPIGGLQNAWGDGITPNDCNGWTPLGKALETLANILEEEAGDQQVDQTKAALAPSIIIISDGQPNFEGEDGKWHDANVEKMTRDNEQVRSQSQQYRSALVSTIIVGANPGSEAEQVLFSIAHGSSSNPVERMRINASFADYRELARSIWQGTMQTLS